MEYVLLDIYWNQVFSGKEINYNVSQLAAIHIDDELHTISTFHRLDAKDSKTAKKIIYMIDATEDIIMDFEYVWEEFRQWLPDNTVFIVWDPAIKHIIHRYNKIFYKKPIKAEFVDLQMLQEVMFPVHESNKSLGDVMSLLGLVHNQSQMLSVLYSVQCTLRLYRKLWKEGRKILGQQEWEKLLQSGDFSELRQRDFFAEILRKDIQMECRRIIRDFCKEKQYELRVKGTKYEIEANQAVWKFDLMNFGDDLIYIPKRYVQMPHYDMQLEIQEQSIVEILPEIFKRINQIEDRLKYGVGNEDVEEVLRRLSKIHMIC